MPFVFNPFTGTLDFYRAYTFNQGGLYGINVETLAANKTLTPNTDEIYQYLNPGGADRTITLATAGATAGDVFIIRNNTTAAITNYLEIQQAAVTIDYIFTQTLKQYIYDGTNWVGGDISGFKSTDENIAIGYYTWAYSSGTAIGYMAQGQSSGVGIGKGAEGETNGVGVGVNAKGDQNSIAIGMSSQAKNYNVALGRACICDSKKYSIAIGNYSRNTRSAELAINICGNTDTDQENNIIIIGWAGDTTDAVAKEILCGGIAAQRCTIRAKSVLAYRITVTAIDSTYASTAMYTFEGIIKRDAANNTTMVLCNKTVLFETVAGWDANVTADDVNEALIITVTGAAATTIQWVARLDGVETHF